MIGFASVPSPRERKGKGKNHMLIKLNKSENNFGF
jgi:hypothetical protein